MVARGRSTAHRIGEAPLNKHAVKNGAIVMSVGNRLERLRLLLTYHVFAGAAVATAEAARKFDRFHEAFVLVE